MTFSARRRLMAGVLVGAALALAGCTVPGQPAPAGAAAALEDVTISNERVGELYSAWSTEAAQSTSRRSVVTLELLREPLLAQMEELEIGYHRSMAEQQATMLLQLQGLDSEPSEALVEAVEATFAVAVFALAPEQYEILGTVAAEVEAEAATSPRTGDFNAARFMASVDAAHEQAMSLANQGMPAWFVAFRTVNGFTIAGAEWLATDASISQ